MNAIQLGNPNLFLKGMAKVTITDPETGNIIGMDTIPTSAAFSTSANLGEVVGGVGNKLLITIPDTVRVTGSVSSQAFSLKQKAIQMGTDITAGAIAQVVEAVTASGTSISVAGTPAKSPAQSANDTYGWAYVREHGKKTYIGTNYKVDLSTGAIIDFTATNGVQYDVLYFTSFVAGETLNIKDVFAPTIASITIQYMVYSKKGNSVSNSSLYGYIYVTIPRAQFGGDAGISGSQTEVATATYEWNALAPDNDITLGETCNTAAGDYAIVSLIPCENTAKYIAIESLGGGVALTSGDTDSIGIVAMTPDGAIQILDTTACSYTSNNTSVATVTSTGEVTYVGNGTTTIDVVFLADTTLTTSVTVVCS